MLDIPVCWFKCLYILDFNVNWSWLFIWGNIEVLWTDTGEQNALWLMFISIAGIYVFQPKTKNMRHKLNTKERFVLIAIIIIRFIYSLFEPSGGKGTRNIL